MEVSAVHDAARIFLGSAACKTGKFPNPPLFPLPLCRGYGCCAVTTNHRCFYYTCAIAERRHYSIYDDSSCRLGILYLYWTKKKKKRINKVNNSLFFLLFFYDVFKVTLMIDFRTNENYSRQIREVCVFGKNTLCFEIVYTKKKNTPTFSPCIPSTCEN